MTSLGGGDVEGLYEVGVSYHDGRGAGPRLTLRTLARRGRWIDSSGRAGWVGTDLPDVARIAVADLLLADVGYELPLSEKHRLAQERTARAGQFASRCPRTPWRMGTVHIDGVAFALWLLELETGFAAFGTDSSHWTWQLTAAPPDVARAVLTETPTQPPDG